MFLDVVSTHTKYIMNDFALAPRTDLLNFKCHTVTNGTDLRKSPLLLVTAWQSIVQTRPSKMDVAPCIT